MSADLAGDPIDPNPLGQLAEPDYAAWYPSATAANVVSYPSYYGYPAQPPYPGPAYPAYSPHPVNGYSPYGGHPGYLAYSPYGSYPSQERRPGEVSAAGTLGLIVAGLLLVSAFVMLLGGLEVYANLSDGSSDLRLFFLAAVMNIVTATVLIVGSLSLLGRARSGRPVLIVGAGLTTVIGVGWLVSVTGYSGGSGYVFWVLVYCGPVIAAAVLASTGRATNWLNRTPSN